jgi:cyclic pyranopterin phosphate synthase
VEVLNEVLRLTRIRLTGGEPTLYQDLLLLSQNLASLDVPVSMTTNGVRLLPLLDSLKKTSMRSINISLDAMSETAFRKVSSRSGLHVILDSIEKAVEVGFEVKLNSVILNGINEHEIIPLTEFSRKLKIPIRFLELMRMGHLYSTQFESYYYSKEKILESLSDVYTLIPEIRKASATSDYWQLEEGGKVGIIANESAPFCADCDRLRLDSFGNIYGCLSSNEAIAIHDTLKDFDELRRRLFKSLSQKQEHGFVGSELSMLKIGG